MAVEVQTLKPTNNVDMLNAIRDEASPEYQARIPKATQAGIQDTIANLQRYRPQMNEFIDALVNKIGLTIVRSASWTNPLAEFKRGMLQYGTTIEEIQIGLIKSKTYDNDRDSLERELFGTERLEVLSNFHVRNRQEKYKITVNHQQLQGAFRDPTGLATFASQIMAVPGTSDQWDEFLVTCALFAEYEANGGYFKVNVPDISDIESDQAMARKTARKLRAMARTLTFLSTKYNASHMPMAAKREDLLLFCTPEFEAAIDVESLAGAFNVAKADIPGRIITIPEEHFGIAGAQALMTTREFFVIADTTYETASMWNPASLSNNYWLHHWQVVSASRFVPAVLFTTDATDEIVMLDPAVTSVSAVTIQDSEGQVPASVDRGQIYQLDATAVTVDPDSDINTGVRWSVAGNNSLKTRVTQTGVLHVAGDEGADVLTVTATATWRDRNNLMRNGASSDLELTVTGASSDELWPEQIAVTGITVGGTAVSPTFDPAVTEYTVIRPGGVATIDQVDVDGPDAGDVDITINTAGDVITISAPSAPGDPVYTVTVN